MPTIYNMPVDTSDYGTLEVAGVGVMFSGGESYGANFQVTSTYRFGKPAYTVPNGTRITATITAYYGRDQTGGVSYKSVLVYECGTGNVISITNTFPSGTTTTGPAVPAVPGCDVLLSLPSQAVVAVLVGPDHAGHDHGQGERTGQTVGDTVPQRDGIRHRVGQRRLGVREGKPREQGRARDPGAQPGVRQVDGEPRQPIE